MKSFANFFWYNGTLPEFERMCIGSFVESGFNVKLHTYSPNAITNLDGVEFVDARILCPTPEEFTFNQGKQVASVAAFSDYYRLLIQKHEFGWYFDTDVYCLKNEIYFRNLSATRGDIIAYQSQNMVNGAAMLIRSKPLLEELLARILEKAKQNMPWGAIGPILLTEYIENLANEPLEQEYFYPLGYEDTFHLLDPKRSGEVRALAKNSYCIHLWNEVLKEIKFDKAMKAPEGSFLFQLTPDKFYRGSSTNSLHRLYFANLLYRLKLKLR